MAAKGCFSTVVFLFMLVMIAQLQCNNGPGPMGQPGQGQNWPATAETAEAAAETIAKVTPITIPIDPNAGGAVSLARNLYVVFDGSGSMLDPPEDMAGNQFGTKIEAAKWAVAEFLKSVPDDTNLGLYVFDARGEGERCPLGAENRDRFLSEINRVRAGGGTPLAPAIETAVEKLVAQYQQQLGYGEFRVVVITDGIADGLEQAAVTATKYGMPIYTIGFCVGPSHPLEPYSVSYQSANSAEDLATGLSKSLAEVESFDETEFSAE